MDASHWSNIIDAGGVGVDYAQCVWDDGSNFTANTNPSLIPPTRSNGTTTHSPSTVESLTRSETSETTQQSPDMSISKRQLRRFCQ